MRGKVDKQRKDTTVTQRHKTKKLTEFLSGGGGGGGGGREGDIDAMVCRVLRIGSDEWLECKKTWRT